MTPNDSTPKKAENAPRQALELGDGRPKPAGTWDWYGCLDPVHAPRSNCDTFSIGVFQWQAKGSGKGTKKGRSIKRFSGWTKSPEAAYSKARVYIAAQAEAGREFALSGSEQNPDQGGEAQ